MSIFRFFIRRILSIGSICIILYGIYALYVWFVPISLSQDVSITIPAGQRGHDTLQSLADNHLIRSPFLAGVYLSITGAQGRMQAGSYAFKGHVTLSSIIRTLTSSNHFSPDVSLTFREGITRQEMADYLKEQGHPAATSFLEVSHTIPANMFTFLKGLPDNATLEGFLFPDTYRVFPDAPAQDIIKAMLANFDIKVTQDMRDEIVRQGRTLFDVVTLASIVEKEVANDEDRAIVAGIFYKRLSIGMPLQSDATVNFVTAKSELQPSQDDLDTESLYNTYKHRGLPPGPIDNPGLSAITAVIFYKKTPYLYFLTDKEGHAIYGKTYEEHLANKRKYLP